MSIYPPLMKDLALSSTVLKFHGKSDIRFSPDEVYTPNYHKRLNMYYTCSKKFPRMLREGMLLFLTALSNDADGAKTAIVAGRARSCGADEANEAAHLADEFLWHDQFGFYVVLKDIEVVDTMLVNCITMQQLVSEVGNNLYPGTVGKEVSHAELCRRYDRKTYISITDYAAVSLNAMLDDLFSKYGKVSLHSSKQG